jgi:putative nucleotidyltransferase with HDIG domain
MQDLDAYISRISHLPPAPQVLPKLLALLAKPNVETGRIVSLIALDPSLTANTLKLCNSAAFGTTTPVADLEEAIFRLGFTQVNQLVAAVSSAQLLAGPQKGYGIDVGELWNHSVTSATAARIMAKDLDDNDSLVFTAALLHDVGKIVLAQALEGLYTNLIDETERNQSSLLETEARLLGVDHAAIGGRLLTRWNFPEPLVAAVTFHHQPDAAGAHQRLAAFIYLGNMIAYFMSRGYGHQAFALRGRKESFEILDLSPDHLPLYMIQTCEQMESIEALVAAAS